MLNCYNLLHPFQTDPGTSQRQRIIDQLLSDDIKIDGRTLADLLDYFSKVSRTINYYDKNLALSDWSPFFRNSLPFLLASIANYDDSIGTNKFKLYSFLFSKQPSTSGLQLLIYFIYYNGINLVDHWFNEIKGKDVPIESSIEVLIRNKLSGYLKSFIALANAATKWYGVKKIDFSKFLDTADNDAWGLQLSNLYTVDESFGADAVGKCDRLKALYERISEFWSSFLEGIKALASPAGQSINQSLVPLAVELKEKHPPHLALIFAFIRLFGKMQGELNKKTKEHLKFFYTEVLGIKSKDAEPDHAHIIFEVQKILQDQYQKYRVAKGTALNGGRDSKNADIFFNTDNEIIVNETQVAEIRTLFLNNQEVVDRTFVEGVYIAPRADKSDGQENDFKTDDPKNWYTLGNKFSKYIAPGKLSAQRHPAARLGFLFASPVLYMAGGTRTITFTIDCEINPSICNKIETDCNNSSGIDCPDYPEIYDATQPGFYARVQNFLFAGTHVNSYYLLSQDILRDAAVQGMSEPSINALRNDFLLWTGKTKLCSTDPVYREHTLIDSVVWDAYKVTHGPVAIEIDKLPDLFRSKYPFKLLFSGEKEWIAPKEITKIAMTALAGNNFTFTIEALIDADRPPVTFYNKDNLGEDFGTDLPLVKIELEDLPGFNYIITPTEDECCLFRTLEAGDHDVSLYHFFRNVTVLSTSKIEITVCGLKNFIVQNDENLMDVNNIIFPFGTRPKPGANFYISSREVLCKNWQEFGITFKWKDKPDFKTYYHGYEDVVKSIAKADLDENKYFYSPFILEDGLWVPPKVPFPPNKPLFFTDPGKICTVAAAPEIFYHFKKSEYKLQDYERTPISAFKDEIFRNDSRDYFLRLRLYDTPDFAFHHSRYSFILTRQMMALGKWPEIDINAVYDGFPVFPPPPGTPSILDYSELFETIRRSYEFALNVHTRAAAGLTKIEAAYTGAPGAININFSVAELVDLLENPLPAIPPPPPFTPLPAIFPAVPNPIPPGASELNPYLLSDILKRLDLDVLKPLYDKLMALKTQFVVIPNEPYTPQIEGMTMDYKALAEASDIDMIHLYPFAGTSKPVEIELKPTLFPTFCDEGSLFIGLKNLQPGLNLDLLFQFAEATADSEKPKEKVHWHYLDNNNWKLLRTGFEVLEDATLDLTASGIIKLALPENMTKKNSVMPAGLHWIKASIAKNSRAVSESIMIHTQAVAATFKISDTNDKARLDQPLEAGSIAKLLIADTAIKSVGQPYDSFGGSIPELDGSYYLRVSERLRHKGRAIQKWDYERLVLQEFSSIYKVKCINHSFRTDASLYLNDVPYAGGYVIVAVLPDLRVLKAGNSFEPKVPVSLLEKIEKFLGRTISPFVRLKASNPRYERINFCITVTLFHGKDKNYYKEKLKSDLREFLAPWSVGKYDKLTFGQCVYRSDVLRFLERSGYVDFVSELRMAHQNDTGAPYDRESVCPVSPRSILVGGEIDVKVSDEKCDEWCAEPVGIKDCPGPVLVQDYCKPGIV